jgi:hypothetical protein
MLKLLRILLLLVIAVVLVEAVVGIVSGSTGVVEKAVILAIAAAGIAALPRVWQLGAPRVR